MIYNTNIFGLGGYVSDVMNWQTLEDYLESVLPDRNVKIEYLNVDRKDILITFNCYKYTSIYKIIIRGDLVTCYDSLFFDQLIKHLIIFIRKIKIKKLDE